MGCLASQRAADHQLPLGMRSWDGDLLAVAADEDRLMDLMVRVMSVEAEGIVDEEEEEVEKGLPKIEWGFRRSSEC